MKPAVLLVFAVAVAAVVPLGACNKSVELQEDAQATDLPPLELAPPSTAAPTATAPAQARVPAEAGLPRDSGTEAGQGTRRTDAGDGGGTGAEGGGACGEGTGRDCPLQAWMKANCAPPVLTGDLDALAAAFDQIATFAPSSAAGFDNWVSIAKDGADAARAASMVGVKGACRGCHQQYKERYRGALRSRPLP